MGIVAAIYGIFTCFKTPKLWLGFLVSLVWLSFLVS